MAQSRFQRSLKGENAEVIVGKPIAYTTQASPALFQANAVEGEIGLYNAATGARLTTAIAAGTKYFIALKRDGQLFRSTTIEHNLNRILRTAYIAPVKQVTTINFPAAMVTAYGTTGKALDYGLIRLIETTPGNEPYPTLDYDYTSATAGVTLDTILTKIVADINNPANIMVKDDGLQYTATKASDGSGGFNIVITSNYFQQHFRVSLAGVLAGGVITYTTPFKQGVGDPDSVSRIEDEGIIFAGVTTNYPGHGVPSEYGTATKFTQQGLTYVTYNIDPLRISKEPMPQSVHHHWAHIYIIVPTAVGGDAPTRAASSPDYIIGTVLGFTLTA